MKTYFREYYNNFKQKPLLGSIVLAMQILFLLGWGIFFYFSFKIFITYYIPGISYPKTNFYADLIADAIILILYGFVFYKFSKIMFSNHNSIMSKMIIITASVISAIFWLWLESAITSAFYFLPETHIAFWAR